MFILTRPLLAMEDDNYLHPNNLLELLRVPELFQMILGQDLRDRLNMSCRLAVVNKELNSQFKPQMLLDLIINMLGRNITQELCPNTGDNICHVLLKKNRYDLLKKLYTRAKAEGAIFNFHERNFKKESLLHVFFKYRLPDIEEDQEKKDKDDIFNFLIEVSSDNINDHMSHEMSLNKYKAKFEQKCKLKNKFKTDLTENKSEKCDLCYSHMAVLRNNFDIIKYLNEDNGFNQSDIGSKDGLHKENLLHIAAWCGFADILRALIKMPAAQKAIDGKNRFGETPLMLAAEKGRQECIQILIDNGAKLDEMDNIDRTALDHAIIANYANAGKILLDNKATFKASWDMPYIAVKIGYLDKLKELLDFNDETESKINSRMLINTAARYNRSAITMEFFNRGYSVNEKWEGMTPLIIASIHNSADAVETLLQIPGILLDSQDKNGKTALWHACQNGHTKVAKQLLVAGASFTISIEMNFNNYKELVGNSDLSLESVIALIKDNKIYKKH